MLSLLASVTSGWTPWLLWYEKVQHSYTLDYAAQLPPAHMKTNERPVSCGQHGQLCDSI